MKVSLATENPVEVKADLLAFGVPQDAWADDPVFKAVDDASDGTLRESAVLEDFTGKAGTSLKVTVRGLGVRQVLVVGLGDKPATLASTRRVAALAGRTASSYEAVALVPHASEDDALRAAASGVLLGAYRFTRYLTGDRLPKRSLKEARVLVDEATPARRQAVEAGEAIAKGVNLARDLVNAPPNELTPTALANVAKAEAKELGVKCEVWDKRGIEKLGMRLLLAVNRGSAEEPRFIHITYSPKQKSKVPKVVFVGKGLTFDAGGLCLKPAKGMLDMKCDMAGAAVTLGVVFTAARLGLDLEVHAIVGSTENMTGEAAYRPGDVFSSLDGKSVEIINTDAEGRLVLADALAYARELNPDLLVDHATLTGACMVALGPHTAGLFTGDDDLAARYQAAAEEEGELYWRLPLQEELKEGLRSKVADLKHVGDQYGGAITAALFLREFVGDATWMHCDIAGPSFQERVHGIHPAGGTGFGIMTAVRFLERLSKT